MVITHSFTGFTIKVLLAITCLYSSIIYAEQVSLKLNDNITAIADYHNPDSVKPAVLIIHGFLQTYNFSTIQYIASELIDNDYPVLTPNLSLGINKRNSSLNCEAIHSHTSNDGNVEIEQWINWLNKQGHNKVILIGHSTGSSQILSYANNKPNASVLGLITTSLGPLWNISRSKNALMDIAAARQHAKTSPNTVQKYTISFCNKNYAAPANAFLSYMHWSEKFTLNAISNSKKPVYIILGENDTFLPLNWSSKLRTKTSNLQVIANADHFFSSDAEFPLQDSILKTINTLIK